MWYLIIAAIVLALTFLFYASYCISSQFYVEAFCKSDTKDKLVALTFDDGPDANTLQVLEILKRNNIKAAFFCIGEKVEKMPEVVVRMQADGHLVCNHSHTHQGLLPMWNAEKILEDYRLCDTAILKATGKNADYVRPPFGVTNPMVGNALKQLGKKVIGWSLRTYDTNSDDPAKISQKVARKIKPGDIVLLHDRLPHSHQTLQLIIDNAKQSGYRIVRFDELMGSN